jgi:hypothetical protein
MKKIILSMAAVLTFGIASAQVPPSQPQQTQPDPNATTTPDRPKKDTNVQNDVVDPTRAPQGNEVQPRKDELKTRDHVKSTPSPAITRDTINQKKKTAKDRKRRS